ncbi:hypothetical protein COZ13_01290 [Candidatus Desantisbacteria bacterium CG_4_10_14_3_um_filter_40_18]|uniref:Right handed beta helix domain-containing protein n=1 Tax=Candidatus Desantisbacteria bacterium CG_4_10_14_3_um_filter_40_18 TaxID=1974544 RepID=A0A2M7P3N0_9BACT|nr:MAG: hypothetical protein COZ13_01290 [Candidatus Desantisbacteria bacterium CG_4_10_14_3_um_filter_40_18]
MKKNRLCLTMFCLFIFISCCQAEAYVEHQATRMNGNAALAANANSGNGTKDDPYIIENWEIKYATTNARAGLRITNTTAFFIIKGCYIHDISDSINKDMRGVNLEKVSNGTIMNCIIENVEYVGIQIENCVDIVVFNNEIKKNGGGGLIEVYNSSGINIEGNNIVDSKKDSVLVYEPYGKGVSVINNKLIGGGISDDGVEVNTCSKAITSEAITYMGEKTNMLIKGNYISGHYSKGVEFNEHKVIGVIVAENIFNGDHFSEDDSSGCEHKDALIVRNTFKNDARIILYFGENFKIYENNFLDNTRVDDNGTNNIWYDVSKGRGNYWQECTIPDTNGDGVRDGTYTRNEGYFQGTIVDLYPLTAEFNPILQRLLGDFGQKNQEIPDNKIDFEDLMWFTIYWNAYQANSSDIRADIAGSRETTSGQEPDLITQKDGVVDFEDLMIFTRMWNWYHKIYN